MTLSTDRVEDVLSWTTFSLFHPASGETWNSLSILEKRGIKISAVSAGTFLSYKPTKKSSGLNSVAQPSSNPALTGHEATASSKEQEEPRGRKSWRGKQIKPQERTRCDLLTLICSWTTWEFSPEADCVPGKQHRSCFFWLEKPGLALDDENSWISSKTKLLKIGKPTFVSCLTALRREKHTEKGLRDDF